MNKRFAAGWNELRSREQGFTLLELLVCMLILSILAATASMYFLHQRRKGWDAQVRASVKHMAGAENHFLYGAGASAFTGDLDDLYLTGYRWNEKWVRPYVALATRETYCIQVHSTRDPSIVWHFSSTVGRPERGPATPAECGDPEGLGTYIAGLPVASYGRDGVLSSVAAGVVASNDPATAGGGSTRNGGGSIDGGVGTTPGSTGGTTGDNESSAGDYVSSELSDGSGSSGTNSGTTDGSNGSGTTDGSHGGSTTGCDGATGGGGSTTGTNHPSGNDRDEESGGSSDQGTSGSDPDGDENDGADKPGQDGGANSGDQDGNNGSGNDTDFEDDNEGPDRDGRPTPGTGC